MPGTCAGGPAALTGREWGLFRDPAAYAEADSMSYENSEFGEHDFTFPHRLPADTGRMLLKLRDYPWMDSLTLDLALEGVRRTGVGRRRGTDLLVVSLSTTDAIGHDYGPASREMHDQLLRIDHWLGWFLDSLAVLVPRERTVFALTADHGVQPFPEMTGAGRPGVVQGDGAASVAGVPVALRHPAWNHLGPRVPHRRRRGAPRARE